MSKKFDTSWFDLKNYDKLNELYLLGWITQISLRNLVYKFEDAARDYQKAIKYNPVHTVNAMTWEGWFAAKRYQDILRIDPSAIDTYEKDTNNGFIDLGDWRNNGSKLPMNTYSVRGTPLLSHHHLANDNRIDNSWIGDESKTGFTADIIYKKQNIDKYGDKTTHVTVDLAANDNQIMQDFRHWLTEHRKATSNQIIKKDFTQSDFDRWIRIGVIPYLDLSIIAKSEGRKITTTQLAHLIFPDEYDVGTTGRITDTTKPEAMRIIKDEVREALIAQLDGKIGGKTS